MTDRTFVRVVYVLFVALITLSSMAMSNACTEYAKPALSPEGMTANAVATAANAALPVLIEAYRQEGLQAIHAAPDKPTALAKLAEIDARWEKMWKAWRVLSAAENAWATAIEGRGDTTVAAEAMRAAFCEVMALWPESVPAKPISLLRCSHG